MPHVTTDDGVKLYYEEVGSGDPIVFVHEFAGDWRSYETQLRFFSRRYRCIAFNARGFPPSDVPPEVASYSQARACHDIRSLLDGLKIDKAHIVGLSMGGLATLHFGLTYPGRACSLLVGPAIILTTLVLAFGLGVTVFSDLPSLRLFGFICGTTLMASLLADLVFLPGIIMLVRKIWRHRVLA